MSATWRALRWLRYLPQRLAHPVRRARAVGILRRNPAPARIVFVCHGNVCRSPYAEVAARHRGLAAAVLSRGFIGPDRSPPDAALRVAKARGIDLSAHRSQLLDATEFEPGDLIFVMNERQRRATVFAANGLPVTVLVLGDLDPLPITRREIPDPWGRPDEDFHASYARIDRILDALAATLRR